MWRGTEWRLRLCRRRWKKKIRRNRLIYEMGEKLTERFRDSWGDKWLGFRLVIGGSLERSISYAWKGLGLRAETGHW